MQKIVHIIIYLFLAVNLFGQNAKEAFKKINLAYQQTPQFSMDITYQYFEDKNENTPTEVNKGFFYKQGKSIKSSLLDILNVQNNNYLLTIDTENKMVLVSDPKINFNAPLTELLDTLLAQCTSIDFSNSSKNKHQYKLVFPVASIYESLTVTYDPNTYFIRQLIIAYATALAVDTRAEEALEKKPKMVISYNNINTKPSFSATTFSEKNYLKEDNGAFIGIGPYINYTFINTKTKVN